MDDVDERLVSFKTEAERSLEEISFGIKHGSLSSSLPSDNECAYINLTIFEGSKFTVRLCMKGFQVVGKDHDRRELEDDVDMDKNTEPIFETVYALLHHLSPSYQHNFHHAVLDKLEKEKDTELRCNSSPLT